MCLCTLDKTPEPFEEGYKFFEVVDNKVYPPCNDEHHKHIIPDEWMYSDDYGGALFIHNTTEFFTYPAGWHVYKTKEDALASWFNNRNPNRYVLIKVKCGDMHTTGDGNPTGAFRKPWTFPPHNERPTVRVGVCAEIFVPKGAKDIRTEKTLFN